MRSTRSNALLDLLAAPGQPAQVSKGLPASRLPGENPDLARRQCNVLRWGGLVCDALPGVKDSQLPNCGQILRRNRRKRNDAHGGRVSPQSKLLSVVLLAVHYDPLVAGTPVGRFRAQPQDRVVNAFAVVHLTELDEPLPEAVVAVKPISDGLQLEQAIVCAGHRYEVRFGVRREPWLDNSRHDDQ